MMNKTMQKGWWATHPYQRQSVASIRTFCGWSTLQQLMATITHPIMKDVVIAGFKTGGRINAVLALETEMFKVEKDKIVVSNMPLLKRWKKTDVTIECIRCGEFNTRYTVECKQCGANLIYGGKKHYVTKKLDVKRADFFWPRTEPCNDVLMERVKVSDGLLFPSPYKKGRSYTRDWAYKLLQEAGETMGITLWNHWLRSQRAHQLVVDYGFEDGDLMNYFGWLKAETARPYAKEYSKMAEKMNVTL